MFQVPGLQCDTAGKPLVGFQSVDKGLVERYLDYTQNIKPSQIKSIHYVLCTVRRSINEETNSKSKSGCTDCEFSIKNIYLFGQMTRFGIWYRNWYNCTRSAIPNPTTHSLTLLTSFVIEKLH